jgi:hypothetical protein
LDFRKPDLDLVKPAGIDRSVMDSDGGVLCKKCKDLLGLVGTKVIGNDVDLTLGGLTVDDLYQKSTNSSPVCRAVALANTSPVCVFRGL